MSNRLAQKIAREISVPKYELLIAVFSGVNSEGRKIAILEYVRLIKPCSRGEAVRLLKEALSGKYSQLEFQFWADSWTGSSGQPMEIGLRGSVAEVKS